MVDRTLVERKVRQVIYGGDHYDAADVFDRSEYRVAKRMFNDHIRSDGDELVRERAENAIEQIEKIEGNDAEQGDNN